MTKYLIMKCEELHDQYECDACREPVCLVDDWKKWYYKNCPDYFFEVYKFVDDNECTLEKDYVGHIDYGMALYFWNKGEDCEICYPTVIAKFPKANRDTPIPKKVWSVFHQGAYWDGGEVVTDEQLKQEIKCCGAASWFDEDDKKYWVYGDYADGRYNWNY